MLQHILVATNSKRSYLTNVDPIFGDSSRHQQRDFLKYLAMLYAKLPCTASQYLKRLFYSQAIKETLRRTLYTFWD